jgi:hypothetical protein
MTEVSLISLKTKALQFPEPVKTLILSEPDQIDSKEFISKLGTWERLLRMQKELQND